MDAQAQRFFDNEEVSSILNAIPEILIAVDMSGAIIWANQQISLLGYNASEITGKPVEELIPEQVRAAHIEHRRAYSAKPSKWVMADGRQLSALKRDGELVDMDVELTPIAIHQTPCVLAIMRRSTSEISLQYRLGYVEMLLNESQSIARIGTWNWDIARETLDWSAEIYVIFGISPEKFSPSYEAFLEKVHPDDRESVETAVEASLTQDHPYQITHRIVLPNGETRYVTERARVYRDVHDKPIRMIGTVQDITEDHRKALELETAYATIQSHQSELEYLAYFDNLTDLPNRNQLIKYIDDFINKAKGTCESFSLLYLDLDGFKEINDYCGHAKGDSLLKEVADKLRLMAPHNSLLARLGGDEFGIVLHSPHCHDVDKVAQDIVDQIHFSKLIDGIDFKISASVGIASYPDHGKDVSDLLKKADIAMYQAKTAGRNQFHFFDTDINERREKRVKLLSDLEKGIARKQFEVYYQPKIESLHSDILLAEALIRWPHPEAGHISPIDFIPVAEESGHILKIGEIVFRDVCAFIKRYKQESDSKICIAINMSVRQLFQPNIVGDFHAIMREYGISPDEIELEITESSAIENVEATKKVLLQFRDLGTTIALDDFGTGYSSLSYLAELPIDTVKIDRAFINDMSRDRHENSICRAIISLSHSLRKKVVAEGVETNEQLAILKELGCDIMQGYLFSEPLPAPDFLHFVQSFDWRKNL